MTRSRRLVRNEERHDEYGTQWATCRLRETKGRPECTERGFLEYHHVVPYADGGAATAENLELRCRAHNAYESERWFGVTEVDLVREAEVTYSVQTES